MRQLGIAPGVGLGGRIRPQALEASPMPGSLDPAQCPEQVAAVPHSPPLLENVLPARYLGGGGLRSTEEIMALLVPFGEHSGRREGPPLLLDRERLRRVSGGDGEPCENRVKPIGVTVGEPPARQDEHPEGDRQPDQGGVRPSACCGGGRTKAHELTALLPPL